MALAVPIFSNGFDPIKDPIPPDYRLNERHNEAKVFMLSIDN
jgi:hypothetical protein